MTTGLLPARPVVDSTWVQVIRGGAALATGMGVGRFVYTPILPLMTAQAGLTATGAANLATANYVGYLIGALVGVCAPATVRTPVVDRGSLIVLVGTLAAMPLTHNTILWTALRLLAGVASALVFVAAVAALLDHLRDHHAHRVGWGVGGVGAGIALSGLLLLILQPVDDWRVAWWASALLATVLTAGSWRLRLDPVDDIPAATARGGTHRWFLALRTSYSLEGIGYIIAGTFLVAAIGHGAHGGLGTVAWILVGLSAAPSAAAWARLSHRWSRPGLLFAALILQAVGIALPAVIEGTAAALLSAVLFGATFLGVATLALAAGTHLRFPRSVALLTVGYSIGQILGPLVVTPLLRQALLLASLIVLAAAAAAAALRIGYPGTERLDAQLAAQRRATTSSDQ